MNPKKFIRTSYIVWCLVPREELNHFDTTVLISHPIFRNLIRCQLAGKSTFTSIKEVDKLIRGTKEKHPKWFYFVEIENT